jgi:integrase
MAKPKKRPVLTHAKVKQTSQERAPFRVWYSVEDEGGKRRRVFKSFADEEVAWMFAEETDREISNHGVRYGDIPPEVRRAFDFYRDEAANLAEAGATVPRFEDLVSASLAEIRRRHHEQSENAVTVAEGIALFIAYKQTRVKHRQLADLKDRLKRFAQDFGGRPLPSITTAEIDAWLSSLRSRRNPDKLPEPPLLAPLSRNHYRANLHALFAYGAAPARGWCDRNPVADLEPESVETGEPEAYAPEDAARVMQTAFDHKPDLVPVLALGMFAGLRVSEALAVDLGKLDHKADEFRVTGKTGPRLAPFTTACKAWLAAISRCKGKAWLQSARTLVDEMRELYTLAKVEQIDNGARHSFISYRCAESRDSSAVADECGNSVQTIKNHYRKLVTAKAAKQFFAIRPPVKRGRKSKVMSIEEGRKLA